METQTTMYINYAPIYDATGQARHGVHLAERAIGWMHAHERYPRKVLDLACGTGVVAQMLAAQGCSVIGLDCSAAMLHIAQAKTRNSGQSVTLIEADMRALTEISGVGHASFDFVSCFGGLNYLVEGNNLVAILAQVHKVLKPGGIFAFDVRRVEDYVMWDDRDIVVYDNQDCLVYHQLHYDSRKQLAKRRIGWFVREIDRWWRGEETHIEHPWNDVEVLEALEKMHLSLELQDVIEEEQTCFYIVRKS
ncbi:MAG: class I SAM-dependent methyltransferase [Chloroflexota bacterium]